MRAFRSLHVITYNIERTLNGCAPPLGHYNGELTKLTAPL